MYNIPSHFDEAARSVKPRCNDYNLIRNIVTVTTTYTARNVSKYGVISGPHFPLFGFNTGKYGPEITPYLDTFHAVFEDKVSPAGVGYVALTHLRNLEYIVAVLKLQQGKPLALSLCN